MRWSFAKYVGSGNDFILFDNRSGTFPILQSVIQRLCQRQWGIGADGMLLLEYSTQADFRMRIFNSDGSEAEMCGNGLRCFVKWLASMGIQGQPYRIEVMQRLLTAAQVGDAICIEMGSPRNIQWNIPLRFENQFLLVHYINTGVPHVVLFVKNVEEVNLEKLGSYIRNYSLWMPKGSNVTVAQQTGNGRIKIRTYERGVEGETFACGTGAAAAALTAARHYCCSSPVSIETRSGETLSIGFTVEDLKFSNVTLTGSAECTFQGEIDLPFYTPSPRIAFDPG
jgi:diaminopimelate epimerase